uniref:(northern house mosquito) hypothetical protein n=1 Tax=Culex pipiens TaxID=7175 RepID=A0A8D8CSC2_CULPI
MYKNTPSLSGTRTFPCEPRFNHNSQSFSTHTLGCCFCSSALRTFLFTFLWKTSHKHSVTRSCVHESREKHGPLICLSVCVCALSPRGGKFHFSLAFSSLLVWGGAQELGSRLHDVCSTRSRRRRWSVVVAVI